MNLDPTPQRVWISGDGLTGDAMIHCGNCGEPTRYLTSTEAKVRTGFRKVIKTQIGWVDNVEILIEKVSYVPLLKRMRIGPCCQGDSSLTIAGEGPRVPFAASTSKPAPKWRGEKL